MIQSHSCYRYTSGEQLASGECAINRRVSIFRRHPDVGQAGLFDLRLVDADQLLKTLSNLKRANPDTTLW